MVRGIEQFRAYFAGYERNYIIIGGTACDILEENAGQQPRATKDIDIILIIEALTVDFIKRFWEFIKAGEYETRQRGNGKHEYYRFLKPRSADFPLQIEISARKPDVLDISSDARFTPIPIGEDLSSLSAVLMNDVYYYYTMEHSTIESGIRFANVESLIVLKAKAYLDLSERKTKGEVIDSKKVNKHKNDIFRLATMLAENDNFVLHIEMQNDLDEFCQIVAQSLPDYAFFKAIGFPAKPEDVFSLLCRTFQVKPKINNTFH